MAKASSVNIIEAWGYDLLYPILQDAYKVLYISFQDLLLKKQMNPYIKPENSKHWHLEDIITDDLIRDEENLPKNYEYRIVNQQKDANRNTRIDIAIQYSLIFGNAYDIKIECKLLNKKNINYFVDGGLSKFKTNKYSAKLGLAGMLAYNTSGNISENISFLNTNIRKKYSENELLSQNNLIGAYPYLFKSTHERVSNSLIDIYTMGLDCKDIIQFKT